MNDFEKTQAHYLKEYVRTMERSLTIGRPVSDPVLKYDEKPMIPDYIELSDEGVEAIRSFSPVMDPEALRKSRGRKM